MYTKFLIWVLAILVFGNTLSYGIVGKEEVASRIYQFILGIGDTHITQIQQAFREAFLGHENEEVPVYNFGQFFPKGCTIAGATGDNMVFTNKPYEKMWFVRVPFTYEGFRFTCIFHARGNDPSIVKIVLIENDEPTVMWFWSNKGYF